MAHVEGSAYAGSTMPQDAPLDESLAQAASEQVQQAAERVTFHRVEMERWERIGRASALALNALQAHSPVVQQDPDGFLDDQKAAQSPQVYS